MYNKKPKLGKPEINNNFPIIKTVNLVYASVVRCVLKNIAKYHF